ncbi:MAG: hypothetical protein E7327_04235 [Clostridiales bacterium]|nr:hypothetical protein [Clostridiales bacterium]
MRAGFGKWELTPPMGVELAGYGYYLGRCAQTVRDPLYARAVMLEAGEERTLVISCDLLGLSKQVCREVFAHAEKYGVPRQRVIIVSIHTHTGPCIKYHEGCGFVDDAYVRTVGGQICRAVDEAAADLGEVEGMTQSFHPFEGDHIYNRTVADGPVDRFVRGFTISRSGKAPICMINAACHGVFRGRVTAVSADFAGRVNQLMEEKGFASIYLNGLCGDIDPWKPTDARLEEFAQIVTDAFAAEAQPLPLKMEAGELPFTLRLTSVTEGEIRGAATHAVEVSGGADKPAARVALTWEREMLEKLAELRDTEEITCKYLLLGGVPVVAFPFEGFTMIGQEVRRILGREDALMLGCGEELLGYLPTRDDIARGAYAALESTFLYKRLPVVPGEAERLGQDMGRALERIMK